MSTKFDPLNQKSPEQRWAILVRAVPTGFEPAISALTGLHVWPLHHGTKPLKLTTGPFARQDSLIL